MDSDHTSYSKSNLTDRANSGLVDINTKMLWSSLFMLIFKCVNILEGIAVACIKHLRNFGKTFLEVELLKTLRTHLGNRRNSETQLPRQVWHLIWCLPALAKHVYVNKHGEQRSRRLWIWCNSSLCFRLQERRAEEDVYEMGQPSPPEGIHSCILTFPIVVQGKKCQLLGHSWLRCNFRFLHNDLIVNVWK